MDLLSLDLRILKLRWHCELNWGDDDDEQPEPTTFHHLAAMDMPEVELEDEEDELEERLGFRLA